MARRPLAARREGARRRRCRRRCALAGGQELRFVAVHPYPPLTAARVRTWTAVLRGLPAPLAGRRPARADGRLQRDARPARAAARARSRLHRCRRRDGARGSSRRSRWARCRRSSRSTTCCSPRGVLVRRLSVVQGRPQRSPRRHRRARAGGCLTSRASASRARSARWSSCSRSPAGCGSGLDAITAARGRRRSSRTRRRYRRARSCCSASTAQRLVAFDPVRKAVTGRATPRRRSSIRSPAARTS